MRVDTLSHPENFAKEQVIYLVFGEGFLRGSASFVRDLLFLQEVTSLFVADGESAYFHDAQHLFP